MKMIREGMEDYEYLKLLSAAGGADDAKKIAAQLFPKAYQADAKPADLMAARENIARLILARTGKQVTAPGVSGAAPTSTAAGLTVAAATGGGCGSTSQRGGVLTLSLVPLALVLQRLRSRRRAVAADRSSRSSAFPRGPPVRRSPSSFGRLPSRRRRGQPAGACSLHRPACLCQTSGVLVFRASPPSLPSRRTHLGRTMTPLGLRPLALSLGIVACAGGGERGAAASVPASTSSTASTGAGVASSSGLTPCAPGAGAAFCWLNPTPQGNPLVGLWGARADDAWIVGPVGSLLHWDGRALVAVSIPTAAPLRAVWGSASDDVWAVGDAVLHYDGRGWSAAAGAPTASWNAVHGSGPGDVWLAGAGGAAAHFDGARWVPVMTPGAEDLSAVAVVGPAEAYLATARGGTVLRWDGAALTVSGQLEARVLSGLFAAGPGDVWAAGEARDLNAAAGARGTSLAHLEAGAWTTITVPGLETAAFSAVHGLSPSEVWVAGADGAGHGRVAHLDASGWHVEVLPALPLRAVRALPDVVLVAGDGGQLFARGASGWLAAHHGPAGYLQAASFAASGEGWFGALLPDYAALQPEAKLLRLAEGAVDPVPLGVADVVYGVWANGPDDVWAGTLANGFLHFDGKRWVARVGGYSGLVDGIWASGPDDVWGVAGSVAVHFDGQTTTIHGLPAGGARRVFGLSPRDVWAVGGKDVAHHWDGTRWSAVAVPGLALAVWGSAADGAWLVGEGGLALRWNGGAFAKLETGTTATLWAVRGTGTGEVWAAGGDGTALRFDGRAFSKVETGTRNTLAAIAVSPTGELFLAGDYGTILQLGR